MSTLIITHDDTGAITGFRYPANEDYDLEENELALDPNEWDHREFIPPRCKRVDTSTDPPIIEDNPDHRTPDPLDRSEIPPDLKQAYRDGRDAVKTAREDFTAARQAAAEASTTAERADAIQSQLDAVATFLDSGVVPAMDTLFRTVMDEEP